MATNTTVTATTTSAVITLATPTIDEFIISVGANPVTLKLNETGNAVYGSGVQIPANTVWSYISDRKQIGRIAIISSGGDSVCAIYYD